MSLDEIPDGTTVLLDANILIYARRRVSGECQSLIQRCSERKVNGVISVLGLAEFCHRRMMQEAQSRFVASSNPVKALGKDPTMIQRLTGYSADVNNLLSSGLQILNLEADDFAVALIWQRERGLLTNDSLTVATACRHGIQAIASNDTHFESLPGFKTYRAIDLPSSGSLQA